MLGFRVWDVAEKRMLNLEDPFELSYSINHKGILCYSTVDPSDSTETILKEACDELIPMQSTGYFDDNATTIFEGDIIEITGFEHILSFKYRFLVESVPHFYANLPKGEAVERFNIFILGNRFENPELLEKVK